MNAASRLWFISTPYIDAYIDAYQSPGGDGEEITLAEFEKRMESQGWSWGEQSVGRAAMRGYEAATHNEGYVVAFGTFASKHYVYVDALVEVAEIPDEWDVT